MARFVGLPALRGKLASYAKRFDMVEVRPLDEPLPRASKLGAWRAQVPPAFAFSVVLPRAVGELGAGAEAALEASVEAAVALQARCIVLRTPASIRPTRQNRERIAALAALLPRRGHVLAWEAAGIWQHEELAELCAVTGLLPVLDAAQEPLVAGPIVYTRIRAIGTAARLGEGGIRRVMEAVAGRRDAYIVADPPIAAKLRSGLAAAGGGGGGRRRLPNLFRPGQPPVLAADDEEQ
jgi:hypothetical protein